MQFTVLLVEDERHILKIFTEMLVKRNYIVKTAESGREAVQKALQERPDLMVLDLILPDMMGIEVVGRLRTHPELVNLPVILMTCGSADDEFLAYIEAYTEEHIVTKIRKPMPPIELLEAIQKALI